MKINNRDHMVSERKDKMNAVKTIEFVFDDRKCKAYRVPHMNNQVVVEANMVDVHGKLVLAQDQKNKRAWFKKAEKHAIRLGI